MRIYPEDRIGSFVELDWLVRDTARLGQIASEGQYHAPVVYSDRRRMTTPKQFDGSRRHVLDWVESRDFLDTVQQWVAPQGFTVATDAIRMPSGWEQSKESRLFDKASPFLDPGRKDTVRGWWLAHAGNIPNWDLIVQAAGRDGPALVLVEAKAKVSEFDCKSKPLLYRSEDLQARERTDDNHRQIGHAIAEASSALSSRGIFISCEHHYQLSNRIAMAWKLASLGVPNTLVFLGFTGDREISRKGDYFADDKDWHRAFTEYLKGVLPEGLLEKDISSGAASFRVLSRSLPAIRDSRPIAERRVGRVRRRNR